MFNDEVQCSGDNDPVDVVEIGTASLGVGSITKVSHSLPMVFSLVGCFRVVRDAVLPLYV